MTDWTPRTRSLHDVLSPWPVRAMRALLGGEPVAEDGEALPLGWHWLFFRDIVPASSLAEDGHARRGDFLPPVSRPRRMWAGGRLVEHRPLILGKAAELRSVATGVEEKVGRSGDLTIVTVSHEVHQGGLAVEEEQVLVYRDASDWGGGGAAAADETSARGPGPHSGESDRWSDVFTPSRVTLFQFSALTWNTHRIHYDHPWATRTEGYQDLLVHAPLTALLLLDAAARHGANPRQFRYRAMAPLYVNRAMTLAGRDGDGGETVLEARGPDGATAMGGWIG